MEKITSTTIAFMSGLLNKRAFALAVVGPVLLVSFNNCSNFKATDAKYEVLSKTSVFDQSSQSLGKDPIATNPLHADTYDVNPPIISDEATAEFHDPLLSRQTTYTMGIQDYSNSVIDSVRTEDPRVTTMTSTGGHDAGVIASTSTGMQDPSAAIVATGGAHYSAMVALASSGAQDSKTDNTNSNIDFAHKKLILPVSYYCSNGQSFSGGNLLANASAELILRYPLESEALCHIKDGVKDHIINFKSIDLTPCQDKLVQGQTYTITVNGVTGTKIHEVAIGNIKYENGAVSIAKGTNAPDGALRLLYNWNFSTSMSLTPEDPLYNLYKDADKNCDRRASPLIVDMREDTSSPKGIELSSITEGILFNILGTKSYPAVHTKKQISWLKNNNYMFIVKPNNQGQVLGVDEMFGDNTLGPDGKYASDGFAALAKYDRNKDNVINRSDAIYFKLRMWADNNFDGVSQTDELYTLDQMGLKEIDLEYDPSFYEIDQYGNETKLKSVVKFENGEYRLLFDLWFRYL